MVGWLVSWLRMQEIPRLPAAMRFGIFEVNRQTGELRRKGFKVKLQEQPFQILVMLLEHSNEVVTREELQQKLWPADTFVDFDRGLNRAINKLREALGDGAESPRFIETLPRRGYRFLAPVETVADGPAKNAEAVTSSAVHRREVLPWALVVVSAALAAIGFWRPWRPAPALVDRPFLQLDLDVGPDELSEPAISADGLRIAFVSKGALAIRRLDQEKMTRVAGTEGAAFPFFSPNGQWVAFFAGGKLQKVAIDGGVPIPLCDAPHAGGGNWGDDDAIVAALGDGLAVVPAAGGVPKWLTHAKDLSRPLMCMWPQKLPGDRGVLFAAVDGSARGSLQILTPSDGKFRTVVENSTQGHYLSSGYLVYHQRGKLLAAHMDPRRLESTGPAIPLVQDVSSTGGRADFDLSASGALVYRSGNAGTSVVSWLYSSGKIEPLIRDPDNYITPRLSPDGTRLALALFQQGKQNIWVYHLRQETWTRLTFGADTEMLPTWTPDGEFVAFRSGNTLAWTRSDGSGKVEHLADVSPNAGPWSFSADGKWLAFWPLQPDSDLWIVPVERSPGELRLGRPQPLLAQVASKGAPALSPDGRWFAYTSNESDGFEVYVRPFTLPGKARSGKWPVSSGGGWSPIWSHDGKSLFYESPDRRVQVADCFVKGDSLVVGKPRAWSGTRLVDTGLFYGFDPAPDGNRVLALLPAEGTKPQPLLRLLLNVDTELRRRMPPHRE